MKYQPSVMAALLVGSSALVPPLALNHFHLPLAKSIGRRQDCQQRYLTGTSKPDLVEGCNRSLPLFASLKSTVSEDTLDVRDASTQQSESPTRRSIAKGNIISAFRGGLFAVRLEDDVIEKGTGNSQIVDDTQSFPNIKASSSSISQLLPNFEATSSSKTLGMFRRDIISIE